MDLEIIVKKYLKSEGYDGLVDTEEGCACKLDDLMPCGELDAFRYCEPGYAEDCSPECSEEHDGWHMSLVKGEEQCKKAQ